MTFGRWTPLDGATAPLAPGLLQARHGQGASGLIDYPTGKSAMACYAAHDSSLGVALERLRVRLDAGVRAKLWVRFATVEGAGSASLLLAELLERFRSRFGALPDLQPMPAALSQNPDTED